MHTSSRSPSHPAWALHALRGLVTPVMLALALLSALVLYAHWGPGASATVEAPAARQPDAAGDPSVPAASDVFTSPYEEITHVQAF